ncbi:hypothetical protein [Azotobacter chroococcum]|jgi:hypothetical protein|uniref:hypothetical protein n=1 Tax=Azotobacter chroococcum TaxID=353 RepID=UPI000B5F3060|nr:hypothetical protein [Azotobacter chroococcum]ASL27622.1 hypothetical protein ACG10_15975 [Azotobacter chroococcum]
MIGTREQQTIEYFDVVRKLAGNQPFIRHLAATLPSDRPVMRQLAEMPLAAMLRLYCDWVERVYGECGKGIEEAKMCTEPNTSSKRLMPSQVLAALRHWRFPRLWP